jgi:hypothetical protein
MTLKYTIRISRTVHNRHWIKEYSVRKIGFMESIFQRRPKTDAKACIKCTDSMMMNEQQNQI